MSSTYSKPHNKDIQWYSGIDGCHWGTERLSHLCNRWNLYSILLAGGIFAIIALVLHKSSLSMDQWSPEVLQWTEWTTSFSWISCPIAISVDELVNHYLSLLWWNSLLVFALLESNPHLSLLIPSPPDRMHRHIKLVRTSFSIEYQELCRNQLSLLLEDR